ncbi:MAG: type IV pilus modification PilV family protein [bacterium]
MLLNEIFSLRKNLNKGFNLVEMLAAFTVFTLCILAILNVIYQAMNLESNSKNIDIALQNIRIIDNYLKHSNCISFNDTGNPIQINDQNLINGNFVELDALPLKKLKFNKPQLFKRNITVHALGNDGFSNRVAVFTITLRWKEKGVYRKVSIKTTISRDRR